MLTPVDSYIVNIPDPRRAADEADDLRAARGIALGVVVGIALWVPILYGAWYIYNLAQ